MTFEQEMQAMACDSDIRAECEAIAAEFAKFATDGLDVITRVESASLEDADH
jgi:hypothetical protein